LRKVKLSNYAKSNAISYHTAWNYHNVEDDKEDLMQDFVSIITSFVARLYAQHRSKRKTVKIIKEFQEN
jgi:hypothetical protein